MKNINLKTIRIDGGTQSRVKLDDAAVADYTQVLKDGGELPPVVVFFDGADNWMADGFHRFHAYNGDRRASIPADVRPGTRRDALLFSLGANVSHGLRRTSDDKRKAVGAMLADEEWRSWSDHAIAKACAVTHPFVGSIRKSLETVTSEKSDSGERTYTTKQGKQATMQTANIGKSVAAEAPPPAAVPAVPSPPPPVDDGPDEAELAAETARQEADQKEMQALLDSDDALKTAVTENKRLRAEVAALKLRIDGLMGEKNEAIKLANSWRRKFEILDKKSKASA